MSRDFVDGTHAAVLAQISTLEPCLKAYQTLVCEDARKAAARSDSEITQLGTTKGPLHGVPIAVKDLYAVAGVPNMGGSAVFSLGQTKRRMIQRC